MLESIEVCSVSMSVIKGLCSLAATSGPKPTLGSLASAYRQFSAATTSVTDQMIQYAMSQCKGQHDQAIDVLKSGLSMHPNGGVDAAKLLIAQGHVEGDRNRWAQAWECSKAAHDALGAAFTSTQTDEAQAASLVQVQAARLASTALLIQSRDAEAQAAVTACHAAHSPSTSPAHLAYQSLSLAVAHTLAQSTPASEAAGKLRTALGELPAAAIPAEAQSEALLALSDWEAGQGSAGRGTAGAGYQQAAHMTAPGSTSAELLRGELHAAALFGTGQLATLEEQWDAAEEALGKALTAAEGVSSDKHARVAPILTLLGHVYSRSARVTFAEGLYRECAKIVQVDPMLHPVSSGLKLPTSVHPSLVSVLAWKFHQLLSVMPNRGRESSAWEGLARATWPAAGPAFQGLSLEEVLGSADQLTGKGSAGSGVLLSLTTRRVLPVWCSTT